MVLRSSARGQGGGIGTGVRENRRQWHLPAAAVLAEGCGGAGGSGVELWGEDGEEKVAGPSYRGDPGISAGRSGIMIPASSPGISGALFRGGEEGKGEREPLTGGAVLAATRGGRGRNTGAGGWWLTCGAGWSAAGSASRER